MKITVSIPVKLGGYTGQREQWEEHQNEYAVSREGDNVVLEGQGYGKRKITFEASALAEALDFIDRNGGS